jgi:hypothetical protein
LSKQTRFVKTHCGRMDHGGCGLVVGARGNEIFQIKGDPEGFRNAQHQEPSLRHQKVKLHRLCRWSFTLAGGVALIVFLRDYQSAKR